MVPRGIVGLWLCMVDIEPRVLATGLELERLKNDCYQFIGCTEDATWLACSPGLFFRGVAREVALTSVEAMSSCLSVLAFHASAMPINGE